MKRDLLDEYNSIESSYQFNRLLEILRFSMIFTVAWFVRININTIAISVFDRTMLYQLSTREFELMAI